MPMLLQGFSLMPSTDIDGSVIVILSREEAEVVYTSLQERVENYCLSVEDCLPLNPVEIKLAKKLSRDLSLPELV